MVAELSRQIAISATGNGQIAMEAYTAGLMHDLGTLLFEISNPGSYNRVETPLDRISADSQNADTDSTVPIQNLVSGFLLGVWGLPDELVQTVAYHQNPGLSRYTGEFSPLTAVHLANGIAEAGPKLISASGAGKGIGKVDELIRQGTLDGEYLSRLGFEDQIQEWFGLWEKINATFSDRP